MMIRLLLLVALAGCEMRSPVVSSAGNRPQSSAPVPTIAASLMPNLTLVPTTRVAIGQNIWLETVQTPEMALIKSLSDSLNTLGSSLAPGSAPAASLPHQPVVSWQNRTRGIERRVVLELEVVLNRGFLEHLISRSEAGKDHESLLSRPFDAEILHAALLGAGLQPGKPAKFINEKRELDYKPATGEIIRIYLEYENAQGTLVTVPAQSWVIQGKDSKPMEGDWVYAGSFNGQSETAEGKIYKYFAANDGRVVCLTNFASALLDLPFESADADPNGDSLGYKANTPVIPERGTKVRALFEGVPKGK